jgi:hypothetical protein
MNRLNQLIARARGWAIAVVVTLALALPALQALALDRITLKSGNKVIEGTIIREVDGNIFFKYVENGVEKNARFAPAEILKIERNVDAPGAAPSAPAPAPTATPSTPASPASETPASPKTDAIPAAAAGAAAAATPAAPTSKVPKAVVITLGDKENGDEVGVYFTAHSLREIIPDLEKDLGTDRSGIVVFRIYSGGGLATEVPKLHAVIRNEYMKRWRVVAWIESSISAAAMTPHCIPDIYFTKEANYGACTMFSGRLKMSTGAPLESVLSMMEKVSREAGYDYKIMRSMQIPEPLSATVFPDGRVQYWQDETSGEILVNRKGEILTLNSVTAARLKFSKGTADTLEDLTRLMGYKELDWIGDKVPGFAWPISREEKAQIAFRKKSKADEERTNEYIGRYQTAVGVAQSLQNKDDRAKAVGKARQALDEIKRMIRNNPAFIMMGMNMDEAEYKQWIEEQEKLLRELMR